MKINYTKNPYILNSFLKYLIYVKNYSINTIEAYYLDLLCFFGFVKKYKNIEVEIKYFNIFILSKITQADILAFLVYLNQYLNNNPYTRQRKLSSIRTFYDWLFNHYSSCCNKINPTNDIPNIEKTIRLPKYLNLKQAKKISNIFTKENCNYPERNNTIIQLILNTGMRASELINLNINNINFKDKYIKVIGKGKKERIIFISETTKQLLLEYLKVRNHHNSLVDVSDPLFLNMQNKRLGIDGLEYICKKAYKLAGLDNFGYTVHTLRHTAAVLLYQYENTDILILKEFMGHATLSSTQIYTHVFNERIKSSIENNPLNISKIA